MPKKPLADMNMRERGGVDNEYLIKHTQMRYLGIILVL